MERESNLEKISGVLCTGLAVAMFTVLPFTVIKTAAEAYKATNTLNSTETSELYSPNLTK